MMTEQFPPTLASYPLIIFYDAVCGLCDRSVQFVLKHDKHAKFKFCALQSEISQQAFPELTDFSSFVLVENGKVYIKSTAALKVLKHLGGWWKFAYVFIIIPPIIRNTVYDVIAKNRYKWFGKFYSCKVPDANVRNRFIDMI